MKTNEEKIKEITDKLFKNEFYQFDCHPETHDYCGNIEWNDVYEIVKGIINDMKPDNFEEAARPLMQWLGENKHPHISVYVRNDVAELLEGQETFVTKEYIID